MNTMRETPAQSLGSLLQDAMARTVAIAVLGGIALIHLLDLPGKFDETPYVAWMYVGLITGCVCLAGALLRSSHTRLWAGALVLPISVLAGFTLSRTTGLPQADGDIGNWTESLGLASLFVEGALVVLAGSVLVTRAAIGAPHAARPGTARPSTSERTAARTV